MHPRHRRRAAVLAAITALTLVAVPGPALAAPYPGADARPESGEARGTFRAVDPADKISPSATRVFQERGATDFWLRFGETADLTHARAITSWSERGEYVYETLTATADATQAQAIAELERSGTEYTSYWATNAILVEDGSLELATDLAANLQVAEVRPTTRHVLEEPVETGTAAASAAAGSTYGIEAIHADSLWDLGFTGEGIVVAGLDTGVSRNHPALRDQYRGAGAGSNDYHWYNSLDPGANYPHDDHGHGTHTMGTMVGSDDGATNIGVAPGARWIATNGCAEACLDSTLVASGQWLLAPTRWDGSGADPAKRPHVVNNSWGLSRTTDPFMEDVIAAWEAAGIFSTWSNGNDGEWGCDSSASPGSRQASYSVGAFSSSGAIAGFSSRGPGQSGTVKPDIAAPGVAVRSAVPGGGYEEWSGTSMAAPHVAGAVALLWDAVPVLVGNVPGTRAILDGSATDVRDTSCGGTTDDNNVWGEGKLDVLAAYELAQRQTFTSTPSPEILGTAVVGWTLALRPHPVWDPAAKFTYQWRRDGAMISGANRTTYVAQGRDAGARITVTVVGSADGHVPTAVTSEPTAVVRTAAIKAADPVINGTVRVGSPLRALSGSWTSGTRFGYQWKANGAAISGATAFTFTPRPADRGKRLTVTVTGSRKGYVGASRTSAAKVVGYGVFAQGRPRVVRAPVPSATVKVSAPPSSASAGTTTYQWRVDDWPLKSRTSSSFTIPSGWKGRVISVSVTRKGAGYATRTVTSTGQKIGTAFATIPTLRITGTARVGSTVRVAQDRWRPGAYVTYQWYSNGRPISGATGPSYRIHGSHLGKKLTVVATGRKTGYATTDKGSGSVTVGRPATTVPADSWYVVGAGGVPAATYVAQAGSKDCVWERLDTRDRLLGGDYGSGQRIAAVRSTDGSFRSQDCGTWVKHYPGMVKPRANTPRNGVYLLDDQLERGTYVTPGPALAGGTCYYGFIKAFTGLADRSHLVRHGSVDEPTTITIPSTARGFETAGCHWYRVS